ncbi:hypothetical protein C5167_016726 [Papaver somniferum]|nr:hypothetical protein C5167_016726 [Papaver somniferum]
MNQKFGSSSERQAQDNPDGRQQDRKRPRLRLPKNHGKKGGVSHGDDVVVAVAGNNFTDQATSGTGRAGSDRVFQSSNPLNHEM